MSNTATNPTVPTTNVSDTPLTELVLTETPSVFVLPEGHKLILSICSKNVTYKIGFLRSDSSISSTSLFDFVSTKVFAELETQITRTFNEDKFFSDLVDVPFHELSFTVMLDGTPYTEKQMLEETVAQFVLENKSQHISLKIFKKKTKTEEKSDNVEPSKKLIHETFFKEVTNCRTGEVTKAKFVRLNDKIPEVATLKSKLRMITTLSMFYRENVEFRPQLLLNYMKALQIAIWGDNFANDNVAKNEDDDDEDDDDEDDEDEDEGDIKAIDDQDTLKSPKIDYTKLPIKGKHAKVEGLYQLVMFLMEEFKTLLEHYNELRKENKILFDYLHLEFGVGQHVYYKSSEKCGLVAGRVKSVEYYRGFFSSAFRLHIEVIKSNGNKLMFAEVTSQISEFVDLKDLEDLSVKKLEANSEVYSALKARGAKFAKYAVGAHYVSYSDSINYKTWCNIIQYKAVGRCMIDDATFTKINPNYERDDDEDEEEEGGKILTVPEEEYFKCWPTIKGFSFGCKKWGEINLEFVSEIQFDSDAYSKLVMAEERKDLIKSLVTNYKGAFKDIIGGKGGGCIFLLHGPPGTGKTLTAEAISELLQKPLYSVTVGELGTTINELEDKLRNILEVACLWDAVVLLDEADIFLEKRSDNDIQRNAMVGIFLRLLEYHDGVMFLTTNRVKTFDEAFHSRISIALQYDPLGDNRAQVWHNLIDHARFDKSQIDISKISEYDINGRQIKNVIRLSETVSKSYNKTVDTEMIIKNIKLTSAFLDERQEKDTNN